ncbi:MAG: dephospho-CoA kinase [Comamonas sp.]|nr:dephospho-CoA kinase [Comamonas sp.]
MHWPPTSAKGDAQETVFRLGLTGGIGSGKSTVAQMLAEHGAPIIDADAIARSLTSAGAAAIPAIAQAFGPQAIDAEGALDRNYMRQLVFAQPAQRQRLEAIIHPLIGQHCQQQMQQAQAKGARWVVFDVPLLVESGHWLERVDAVLVVDCDEPTQIQRVMQRSGLSRTATQAILAAQAQRAQRNAAAHWIIDNGAATDLPSLRRQVQQLMQQLRQALGL